MSERWPPPSSNASGLRPASTRSSTLPRVGADDEVVGAVAARAEHVGQRDLLDAVEDRLGVQVPAHRPPRRSSSGRKMDVSRRTRRSFGRCGTRRPRLARGRGLRGRWAGRRRARAAAWAAGAVPPVARTRRAGLGGAGGLRARARPGGAGARRAGRIGGRDVDLAGVARGRRSLIGGEHTATRAGSAMAERDGRGRRPSRPTSRKASTLGLGSRRGGPAPAGSRPDAPGPAVPLVARVAHAAADRNRERWA